MTFARVFFSLAVFLVPGIRAQDDSQVRPPVTKADLTIVKRAREILSSPGKWNRADTRICPKDAKTFSLYCAIENATDEVTANFQHRGAAMQEARFLIDDLTKNKDYDHRLMGYNNDPTTTFADIQKVFDLLEARISKRLETEPAATSAPASGRDLDVLKLARSLLDSPAKWNRADDQKCPAGAPTVSVFCAFELAAIQLKGNFDNNGAAIEEARSVVSETAPNARKYGPRLTDYNNDPTVSFDDVQKLFRLVEERLTKRAADAAHAK
jgi:hypothetical protein